MHFRKSSLGNMGGQSDAPVGDLPTGLSTLNCSGMVPTFSIQEPL